MAGMLSDDLLEVAFNDNDPFLIIEEGENVSGLLQEALAMKCVGVPAYPSTYR